MADPDLVVLRRYRFEYEARVAHDMLRDAGIGSIVTGAVFGPELATITGVSLLVHPDPGHGGRGNGFIGCPGSPPSGAKPPNAKVTRQLALNPPRRPLPPRGASQRIQRIQRIQRSPFEVSEMPGQDAERARAALDRTPGRQ